ncbi:MAG: flagellar M-ring protein FliF [Oscillospiraceae bacterium]|nr:flagellar M-ring protein FliF [Oscillospiraceae bacterium]
MAVKEQVTKVKKTFTTFWDGQSKTRRIVYISILAAIVLLAVIVTVVLNKKDYVVLYEGLETTEAAEMVALIEEMGYGAELSGGSITVLKGTEDKIAIALAQQNYPKSNMNYTLTTEKTGMFTTNDERKTYDRIDMENKLGALIGSMENINAAVVTLTEPEQKNTVISSNKQYPTAGVVVYLDGIDKLSSKQVVGITNLVKMSWSGLTDENISIIDSYGIPQVVANESEYDLVVEETKKLAFKTTLENTIKDKILAMLIPIYGDEGVSVAVNMVLDFDSKVSETTDYGTEGNTNAGVLQHADVEAASGGTTVDGGVVGVEGNADDTYPTGNTNGGGSWSEEAYSNTYLVDTYKEQVEKAGYDIEGLSISVVVYTDYLSEAEKQDLVSLVANAGTINPAVVEDVVTVTNFRKFGDLEDVPTAAAPKHLFGLTFDQLILVGAIVLILILVILIVMAILSSNSKKKRKEFEKRIIESSGLVVPDGEEPVDTFTFSDAGDPVEVPSLTDDQIETKEVVIRREISEFAKFSPEIVAQLLRSWMKEEED